MMCYRDRTFCRFYEKCVDGKKCGRALTPEVEEAAEKWWGSKDAPICEFVDEPKCMTKCITIWEKLDKESGKYKHNHIDENGFVKGIAPIAKTPEQKKAWKKATWRSKFAYMRNRKIIDKDEI